MDSVRKSTVAVWQVSTLAAIALLSSCNSSQTIPGLNDFKVGVSQNYFFLTFAAPNLATDFGITIPVPGLPGATVSLTPDLQSPGSLFDFTVPFSAFANKAQFYPESGLPDGRALPDVTTGTLPRWDVKVSSTMLMSFYLSDQAFALFVPLQFGGVSISWPWELSASIEDGKQNLLGKIYLVPGDVNGKGSGLFILLPYLSTAMASLETNG